MLAALTAFAGVAVTVVPVLLLTLGVVCRVRRLVSGRAWPAVAFFHPYCNDGGGGERVLWIGIEALLAKRPGLRCAVFTGDEIDPATILQNVQDRFGLELPGDAIDFVYLTQRPWVEAKRYPRLTLLGQSVGSMILALEAVLRLPTAVFVDTTGMAFSFPVARFIGGCKVGCYVHYPTISTDMLAAVASRKTAHNNASAIASSPLRSAIKLIYYRMFAAAYAMVGRRASVIMANSSWTAGHVEAIWGSEGIARVYPPCNTVGFQALPLALQARHRAARVISIAQFRPEKAHGLQLEAFALLLKLQPELKGVASITLAGACRHEDDYARLAALKAQAKTLGLREGGDLFFEINVPFARLGELMGECGVGIHTMWNEHFGIGVVEMMAAGLATIAHNSGGPKADIVVDWQGEATGLLAATPAEYAAQMGKVLAQTTAAETARGKMATNARNSVARFSDEAFSKAFVTQLLPLLTGVHAPASDATRRPPSPSVKKQK